MSEELTTEEQQAMNALSEAVATELAQGQKKQTIVEKLVKQEWPEETAVQFVDSIEHAMHEYTESPEARNLLAGKYARHMIYGILWAVGGTIVTVVTYQGASAGGTYVVAWGAILYGIIDFFRGLFGWLKYKS